MALTNPQPEAIDGEVTRRAVSVVCSLLPLVAAARAGVQLPWTSASQRLVGFVRHTLLPELGFRDVVGADMAQAAAALNKLDWFRGAEATDGSGSTGLEGPPDSFWREVAGYESREAVETELLRSMR